MNGQLPDNFTSAHFDGELTADEAAIAERRLQEDAAARDEFDGFSDIRDAIGELPRHTLPGGFADAVLRECERGMLLPMAGDSRESIERANSWRPVLSCLLSTVALVFIAVRVATTPEENGERAGASRALANSTEAGKRSNSAGGANTLADNRIVVKNDAPRQQGNVPRPFGRVEKSRGKALNADEAKAGDKGPRKEMPTNNSRRRFFKKGGFGNGALTVSKDAERTIHIGDVIPYLEVRGERTAVIEVTVIDVQQAVGRLEVLLSKKLVNPSASKTQTQSQITRDAKQLIVPKFDANSNSPRQLVAVYVESNKPQLTAVMSALGRQTGAVHLALKPPVAFNDVRISNLQTAGNAGNARGGRSPATLGEALARVRREISRDSYSLKIAARKPAAVRGKFGGAGQKRFAKSANGKGSRQAKNKNQAAPPKAPAGNEAKKSRSKQIRDAEKSTTGQPFRLWMQLDSPPAGRNDSKSAPGRRRAGKSDPSKQKTRDDGADQFRKSPPRVAPFRVIIVLRQRPRTVVAPKP